MKKFLILFLIYSSIALSLLAQQQKTLQIQKDKNSNVHPQKVIESADTLPIRKNLMLIGRSYGDSVVLRWAPTKPTLWYLANKSGYSIIRYQFENKKLLLATKKILSTAPIKPWTLNEWKKQAQPSDSLAAVCAELLYGKSKVEVTTNKGVNLKDALNSNYDLQNKHGMALFLADQSFFLSTGLGLRYTDKDFEKGKSYAYVVYALTDPKIVKSDTSAVLINTAETMPVPEMPKVQVEELDRIVKFSWNRQIASAFYTGYYYERSVDNGKTYKRLNRRPYTQLTTETNSLKNSTIELNDSLPINYKQYYYRIIGVTPFGDFGKPSMPLPVMGRDRTPPNPPVQISAKNIINNQVKISWTKKIKEPDFMGYLIGRGTNAKGPFFPIVNKLLPADATEFIDLNASRHGTNYYVVSAIDTAGNAAASIPAYVIMTDTIPPAKPVGLAGKIDTTGIVHIHWNLGQEPDLLGYLVYSANDIKHTFIPVTKDFLVDTSFTDSITLKTLTKNIYYKVRAFDRNRNPSAFSEALEMKRPDKVPPVAPVFNNFSVNDTGIVLKWVTSSSDDVASQVLYRREKGKEWIPYAKLTVKTDSYFDKAVKKQQWYEYSLEAIDKAGLHSQRSFPMNVRMYDSGKRREVSNFTVTKTPDSKSVQLTWKYAEKGDFWFVIYRSKDDKGLMTYKNIPSDQHSFVDANLEKGIYQYSIKAVYKDGGESNQMVSAKIIKN